VQAFLCVCETGSITAAAAVLAINHSTVVRRIAALEQTTRSELFERRPTGYALTPSGREMLANLAGVGERIDASSRRTRGIDDDVRGLVRLTTTDTLVRGLLTPHLQRFCEQHPSVHLQVVVNNHFLSLTRREADVAIRGSNRPPENLVGRRVGDIQTAPYASLAYLEAMPASPPLAELDWIAPDDSLSHLAQAAWLRRNVDPARIAFSVDSLVGMADAVARGLGAAMLLCPLGDARLDLRRLAEPDPLLNTQIWILTHPDLRQVARVRAFSQFMFDALSSDPGLVH
jgi:DNA-binding transcriptional LysR family regulator